jgi:hypothetical protein
MGTAVREAVLQEREQVAAIFSIGLVGIGFLSRFAKPWLR